MQTRRETLKQSAMVAGLLAATGLFPQHALAACNKAAFEAKSVADAVKALGGGAPTESKDVTLTGPGHRRERRRRAVGRRPPRWPA